VDWLWQNGLVQIKFFFQINPEAIVFFDWPRPLLF